ncbi:MFS transporter [Bradyrhizobium prioriisuperbiae]|uniref:MFS transporter n=1 Tax=Bradyrhizobium prioriisuperbiae TaxID=2854389 RepID=UPI0028F061C9|nr:MFS transporter [Bradyrhizobium prioritasuperba]
MTLDTTRSDLPPTIKPASRMTDATVTLWAVCISGALFQFDLTALAATLADVGADLGTAEASSAWVIDIYSLALVFSLPASGTLADRFGRRRLFALGTALFAMASVLCALAPSFAILLLCRALQGISGACFTTASLALLAAAYHGPDRARAFSIAGTVIGAAMVAGPPLGALIASTIGWRWIFWLNVPLCAVVLALTFKRVAESADPGAGERAIDGLGCALLALAIGSLAFVLLDGRSFGWLSPAVVGLLAISLVSLVAFVRVERRHAYPAIDLSLLRSPEFLAMCITPVATSVGYWSLLIYVPQFARDVMGLHPVEAGWLLTVLTVPMLLLPRLGAVLAARLPAGVFFPMGLMIIGVADCVLAAAVWAGPTRFGDWPVIVALLCSGTGAALIQSQTSAAAIGAVPGGRAAMAAAICVTLRQLGFSLGIALLGFLLQAGGGAAGFALAFWGAALVTLTAAVACYVLNRR